jgi:nucleotide-binding universal stress UspA family protein
MEPTIVVPLDGSAYAEGAVPTAQALAARSGAELYLVHVCLGDGQPPIYVEGLPVIDSELRSKAREHRMAYLERIRDRLTAGAAAGRIHVRLIDAPASDASDVTVAAAVAAEARRVGAGLIVMTTHGRGGLARFWLGSVADALLREAAPPTLLLRPTEQGAGVELPVLGPILIPLDGSALAEQIIQPAQALGRHLSAEYMLLQVVEPFVPFGTAPFTEPVDHDPDRTRRLEAEALTYLERVAAPIRTTGAQVHVRVRVATPVAPAVLEEAAERHAGLIALATHGRSGVQRALLGSVADKVLRGAETPVLIYRPRTREQEAIAPA